MATDKNFVVKNGLEVGGVLIVNSSGQLQAVTAVGNINFSDNVRADFGNGTDLRIVHNGTNSFIENHNGDLKLIQYADDKDIVFHSDDGSGGVTEYFRLDGSLTKTYFEQNVQFNDNVKAQFGAGADLSLSHNGTHSYIDNNQGSLYISSSNTVQIENSSGNDMITAASGGAVTLFYNAFSKLATTSSGVDITGTLNTSGAIVASGDGHTFYSGGGSSTASFGRNANERLQIYVDDGNITLTADQDSDSNGTHEFILDRTFDGTGANNFVIKKGGTTQLLIDTSGHTRFFGEIHANDSNSTTDPSITFNGHTTTGMSVSYSGSQDELNFITGGTRRMHLNDAGVTSFANVYTGSGSAFRNYAGVWQGTTGVTGNGFKFVNTADSVTPFNLTSSGQLTLTNQSTTTYMTHLSNGQLRNQSSNGYIEIGPANTSHAHIETDRSNFYFNTELRVDTGVIGSYNEDLYLRRATSASGQLQLSEHKLAASAPSKSDQLVLGGFVAEASLENSRHFYHPGLQSNALAGLHDRGTVTATKNGSAISLGEYPFVAGSGHADIGVVAGNTDTVVITLSGFTGLSYSSSAGIVFGNDSFRARDIEIETSTDGGSTWTSRLDVTNQAATTVVADFSSGGTATNAIRYTLTNFNTTNCRVLNLFAYRYDTSDQYFPEMYRDSVMYADLTFRDNKSLKVGNGGDLQIYHDGSSSLVRNYTNDLYIQNDANDRDIIIRTDDGSGGVTQYMTFDGSDTLTRAYKTILFQDSVKASFGNSEDMRIKHDGTDASIDNYTGDLYIRNNTDDKDIIIQTDNGSGGVTTYMTFDGSNDRIVTYKNVTHSDNVRGRYGSSNDLQIYHDGTDSWIQEAGTGNLNIKGNGTFINFLDGSNNLMAYMVPGGAVGLYHNTSPKLATKSDGVDITGELQADSLDIDGAGDISGNLTVHGNLTVNGSTVTNSATNTTIEDALIELGSGNTGTNSNDLGLILERGTSGNNVFMGFDESDDQIVFGLTTATGSSTGNLAFSSFLPIKIGTLNTTGGVTHNISATSEEVMVKVTNDAGHRNALTLHHDYDRDIGIHYHSVGGDYEVWMDSAGDDSLIFSPTTAGNPALELYQNKKAQFYGTAQFDSTVTFDVAGTNVEFLSDTTTREVLSFKQSGITKWLLKLKNDADLNLIPSSASSNFQINSSDFVDGNRNLTVSSLTASGTSTLSGDVLVNGAHNNNGNAKLAVESGVSGAQISLYGDQIQLGNTSMNYHMKIVHDASTNGNITLWNSNLTIGSQGTNTGSAAERDIIFAPQTSGTAVSTERMRIKGDGNVGIGTSTPTEKLHVNGKILAGGQIRSGSYLEDFPSFSFGNDTDTGMFSDTADQLEFSTGGTSRVTIDSSGNVGINTTHPDSKLDVTGGDITVNTTGTGFMNFKYNNGSTGTIGTDGIDLKITANADLQLLPTGNVGVGTSSPSFKLDVVDAGTQLGSTGFYANARFKDSDNVGVFLGHNNTSNGVGMVAGINSLAFLTYSNSAWGERMRISGSNVGFGTSSPEERIEVNGNVRMQSPISTTTARPAATVATLSSGEIRAKNSDSSDGGLLRLSAGAGTTQSTLSYIDLQGYSTAETGNGKHIFFGTGGADRMVINGSGNVGIGTSSPGQKLDVIGSARIAGTNGTGTADYTLLVENTNTNAQAIIKFKPNGDRNIGPFIKSTQRGLDAADGDIQIGDENGTIATFNVGRVGIGNTSPSSVLEVADATPIITLKDTTGTAAAQNASPYIRFYDQNSATLGYFGYSSTSNNHFAIVNQQDAPVKIHTNNQERLRVLGSGDVAINRTSALSDNKLSITADSGEGAIGIQCNQLDGSTKLFDVYNSGGTNLYQQVLQNDSTPNLIWRMHDGSSTITERMRFTHDGKLGINDSAPSKAKLQINQQSNTLAAIQLTNSSQTSGNFGTYPISIFFGDEQVGSSARHQASINAVREAWSNSPAALTFKTSATVNGATEKMRIASDGDVGIGTTTPAFKLDVNGNMRANGYIRVNSGGSFRLYNSAGDAWVELFFDQTNNMLQVQRGFKPSADSALDLGTTAVRWRNVYADNYYGSGANLTGVLTGAQDLYTGSTHSSNSFIDFDDDAGVGGAINTTSLVSVSSMNFIIDSNNNGTDKFHWLSNNTSPSSATQLMDLDESGNLNVTGQLSATTKSFDIEHPTKEGKRLHHGVLEGPEHAVYIRGKSNSYIIELPDYWEGLVHEDTITVQLTPIGGQNDMWIENIEDNKVYIDCEREMKQYFYFIQAERKDVERFEVEYEV